jgi:hypothetical protein
VSNNSRRSPEEAPKKPRRSPEAGTKKNRSRHNDMPKHGERRMGKVDKIYPDNTNLIYNLPCDNANTGNIREHFFF